MVRRSARARKVAVPRYDPSPEAKAKAVKPSPKQKKDSEHEDSDDEHSATKETDESEVEENVEDEDEEVNDDESQESDSKDSEDEEPSPPSIRSAKKSKQGNKSPASGPRKTADKIARDEDSIDSEAPPLKVLSKKRTTRTKSQPRTKSSRSQAVNALTTLAKKFGNDDSLAVQLMSCWEMSSQKKKRRSKTESLYKDGIEAIVLDFLNKRKDNVHETEVMLLNFIFHCAGGKQSHIAETANVQDDIGEDEWGDIINEIIDEMGNTPQEKILMCVNPKPSLGLSEYRKIYEQFWYTLAMTIVQNSSRWGLDWITAVTQRLVEISGIGVPDVRFSLVVAIYQVGRALLDHNTEIQSKVSTASRQLKASKSTQSQRKAHLEKQLESWKTLSENTTAIVRESIVIAVFTHRYRDAQASIRAASLSAIGDYCLASPSVYLQSAFLKYIGWMIFDPEKVVRCAALKALLQPLLTPSIDRSGMEAVLAKYLRRIVEICTCDTDAEVAELGMELALSLLENDLFDVPVEDSSWEDLNLCPLSSSRTPKFRRDALCFVLEQLTSFDDGAFSSERVAAEQIGQLAQWLGVSISSEDEDVSDLRYDLVDMVVDSIDKMPKHRPLLSNWSAMLRALSSEQSKTSDSSYMDTVKQRVILRMLFASAKKSRESEEDDEGLTLCLLRSLPALLVSFKSDDCVLQSLVVLPQYMSPGTFGLSSRRKEFKSLLEALADILLQNTDVDVLLNCGLSLSALSMNDHPRRDEALAVVKDVVMTLRLRLTELINDAQDGNDGDKDSTESVHGSLALCAFRLGVMSKQTSVCLALGGRTQADKELESLSAELSSYLEKELKCRKTIAIVDDGEEQVEIPEIWENAKIDAHTHESVAKCVSTSLVLLLSETSWRLTEEVRAMESPSPPEYTEDLLNGHIVVRAKNRLTNLVNLCFDMFLEDFSGITYSDAQVNFSAAVQEAALRCIGDLRTLFPHQWTNSSSAFLQACAQTKNETISGAVGRFLACLEYATEEEEITRQANEVFLPAARGVATNFQFAHRQEVAALLAPIAGHSKRATDIILGFSRAAKKENPIRFLEVHMAALQTEYESWAEREPEDVGDTPTDSQLTVNDEENSRWREEFDVVVAKAAKLAPTLGIGKHVPAKLNRVFRQFFFEGLRFAFSREDPRGELLLGSRLSFLTLLSKYARFIRQTDVAEEVATKVDELEALFRRDEDFEEDQIDIEPLLLFREVCGFRYFTSEDTDTVVAGSTRKPMSRGARSSFAPRMSTGSSVSSIKSRLSKMESVKEEDEESDEEAVDPRSAFAANKRRNSADDESTAVSHKKKLRKARMSTGSSVSSIRSKLSKMDSVEEEDEESGEESTHRPSFGKRRHSKIGDSDDDTTIETQQTKTINNIDRSELPVEEDNSGTSDDGDETTVETKRTTMRKARRPSTASSVASSVKSKIDSLEEDSGEESTIRPSLGKRQQTAASDSEDDTTIETQQTKITKSTDRSAGTSAKQRSSGASDSEDETSVVTQKTKMRKVQRLSAGSSVNSNIESLGDEESTIRPAASFGKRKPGAAADSEDDTTIETQQTKKRASLDEGDDSDDSTVVPLPSSRKRSRRTKSFGRKFDTHESEGDMAGGSASY